MSLELSVPRLAERFPELTGLEILVVGLGRSGVAAARLAASLGARVTGADRRPEAELGPGAAELRELGVALHTGGHPTTLVDGIDLVILSPGVPPTIDLVRVARSRELPVWGEIELAARFCRGRVIGITGSNGKSTVTTMAGRILRGAAIPGGTGGNLATPFAELLADDGDEAVHALELSSFQLETVTTLRADVAVILNLSPDHLDRYASFEAYADAKGQLLDAQEESGFAILNADDPSGERYLARGRGRRYLFSTRREPSRGAFLRGGKLVLRIDGSDEELLTVDELPLPGEHNIANALAAALSCRLVGCPGAAIADGLSGYRALPHRLEHVRTLRGIAYYNDSKATNPSSTASALAAFEPDRVHLILGGRDKGTEWDELLPLVRRHVRRLLLVGEATPMLKERFAAAAETVECGTIGTAVAAAHAAAAADEVVLLSPGCASFDQYQNFEERGDDFRRAVAALDSEDTDA